MPTGTAEPPNDRPLMGPEPDGVASTPAQPIPSPPAAIRHAGSIVPYGVRVALLLAVWAAVGGLELYDRGRNLWEGGSDADFTQVDVSAQFPAIADALVSSGLPGGASGLGSMPLLYDSLEKQLTRLVEEDTEPSGAAVRVAALLVQRGEPERAVEVIEGLPRGSRLELAPLARGLRDHASPDARRDALGLTDDLRPRWASRALRVYLLEQLGQAAEAQAERQAALRDAMGFIAVAGPAIALMGLAAVAGVFVLPVYAAVRWNQRTQSRDALRAPSQVAPDATPPDGGADAGFAVPQFAPPQSLAAGAQVRAPVARWSVLEAFEAITALFVGQSAMAGLCGLAARAGLALHPVHALAVQYIGGGLAAVWLAVWRARRAGPDGPRALGIHRFPLWRMLLWGVGGYCGVLPLIVGAGLLLNALSGGSRSINPAIDLARSASHPLDMVAMLLTVAIGAPLVEEILFRGALLGALRTRLGPTLGILLSSTLFCAVHLDPFVAPQLFLLGLAMAHIRERTGSVYPGVVLHAIQNGASIIMVFALGRVT